MSLIGLDIGTYEDMFVLNKERNINLFQISARYLSTYLDKITRIDQELELPTDFKVVVHYSYSINLAHTWNKNDWWIQQLITEIESADKIGAFALVIHTGKSMYYAESAAINNMFSSLLYVHQETSKSSVKLLIETPAGQGTELLTDILDFVRFIKKFSNNNELSDRFGICIDTCHIYSAGYDISEKKGISMFFDTIDKEVGISKIKLVHLNNSKSDLGSGVDRHDNLESGTLSMKSIRTIAQFIDALGIPMILETPSGDDKEYILKDYDILRSITERNKIKHT